METQSTATQLVDMHLLSSVNSHYQQIVRAIRCEESRSIEGVELVSKQAICMNEKIGKLGHASELSCSPNQATCRMTMLSNRRSTCTIPVSLHCTDVEIERSRHVVVCRIRLLMHHGRIKSTRISGPKAAPEIKRMYVPCACAVRQLCMKSQFSDPWSRSTRVPNVSRDSRPAPTEKQQIHAKPRCWILHLHMTEPRRPEYSDKSPDSPQHVLGRRRAIVVVRIEASDGG